MLARRVLRVSGLQQRKSRGPRAHFSCTPAARADFTHVVVGGGVVGLAIAHQLSRRANTSTLLLERHSALGTETSSRNSEVIHAGIYYGKETLKTALCLRGKQLLYGFCERHGVPFRQTGKWIVAQDDTELDELRRLKEHCEHVGVPMRWVSRAEVTRDGEGVSAQAGALESPTTGIVDVHTLMMTLQGLLEHEGGIVAMTSCVDGAEQTSRGQWELRVRDVQQSTTTTVSTETLINAAGLDSVRLYNEIVVPARRKTLYYAKGNYFSYAASRPRVSRLVYPAPKPGAAGLGTHLTLDMAGRIRFGPDIEWVSSPDDLAVSAARLPLAVEDIKRYLPGVDETCLQPDYAGIRPKLSAGQTDSNFNDFIVRLEEGYTGWVNCLGIESPGLTSSLAIAERIEQLLYGSTTS